MHEHITGWELAPSKLYALSSSSWNLEGCKSALHIAMQIVARKYEAHVYEVALLHDPYMCIAKSEKPIPRGALTLVACSSKVIPASSLKKGAKPPNNSSEAHVMDHAGNIWNFFIAPTTILPEEAVDEEKVPAEDDKQAPEDEAKQKTTFEAKQKTADGTKKKTANDAKQTADEAATNEDAKDDIKAFICPFWFVQRGTDSNMIVSHEVVELGPFSAHVPLMSNSKRLTKGDVLVFADSKSCKRVYANHQATTASKPAKTAKKAAA